MSYKLAGYCTFKSSGVHKFCSLLQLHVLLCHVAFRLRGITTEANRMRSMDPVCCSVSIKTVQRLLPSKPLFTKAPFSMAVMKREEQVCWRNEPRCCSRGQ